MYLSRLTLDPRNRRVQKELANPYELHRTLMSVFPETLPEGERVLFRVDVDDRTGVPTVLLQSHGQPDWAWLGDPRANGYLLRAPESKPFELTFAPGQTLSFRLRANPTIKHSEPGQRQGRRDPLYKEMDQLAWLERKAAEGGFRITHVAIAKEGNTYGRQPVEKNSEDAAVTAAVEVAQPRKRKLTHFAVRFEGFLQVTDPAKLWETVQAGIGPGKGLGFGLLSLAPAR
ncbi:MAG TPA: type I-E CRISPR-associated protein Cas6/Cse3/CasE [Anaerolineae bacterium]|nr:type I-E CRISPR-associated protein Cas6/Cse3/CasE [Anaerolineae bacterium]